MNNKGEALITFLLIASIASSVIFTYNAQEKRHNKEMDSLKTECVHKIDGNVYFKGEFILKQ